MASSPLCLPILSPSFFCVLSEVQTEIRGLHDSPKIFRPSALRPDDCHRVGRLLPNPVDGLDLVQNRIRCISVSTSDNFSTHPRQLSYRALGIALFSTACQYAHHYRLLDAAGTPVGRPGGL